MTSEFEFEFLVYIVETLCCASLNPFSKFFFFFCGCLEYQTYQTK